MVSCIKITRHINSIAKKTQLKKFPQYKHNYVVIINPQYRHKYVHTHTHTQVCGFLSIFISHIHSIAKGSYHRITIVQMHVCSNRSAMVES